MPRGKYTHSTGRVEAFSCAPGPAGWRYVSDRLDLACDSGFRPVRFSVGSVTGRGARLDDGTAVLVWARATDSPEQVGSSVSPARVLLSDSPGSWVAAVRAVAAPGQDEAAAIVSVLRCGHAGGGVLLEQHRFTRVAARAHPTDSARLLVETWQVDELAAGVRRTLHLAGDVLIHGEFGDHEVEVSDLESPPNFLPGA